MSADLLNVVELTDDAIVAEAEKAAKDKKPREVLFDIKKASKQFEEKFEQLWNASGPVDPEEKLELTKIHSALTGAKIAFDKHSLRHHSGDLQRDAARIERDADLMESTPKGSLDLMLNQPGQPPQPIPPPSKFDLIRKENPHFIDQPNRAIIQAIFNRPEWHKIANNRTQDMRDFSAVRALFPQNRILMATDTSGNEPDIRIEVGIAPSKDRTSTRFIQEVFILPAMKSQLKHREFSTNPFSRPAAVAEGAAVTQVVDNTQIVTTDLERIAVAAALSDELQSDMEGALVEFTTVYNNAVAGKLDELSLYGKAANPTFLGLVDVTGINSEELYSLAGQPGDLNYQKVWKNLFAMESKISDVTEIPPNLFLARPSFWGSFKEGLIEVANTNFQIPMSAINDGIQPRWQGMTVITDKNVRAPAASTNGVAFMVSNDPQNLTMRMLGGYETVVTRDTQDEQRSQTSFVVRVTAGLQVRYPESIGQFEVKAAART